MSKQNRNRYDPDTVTPPGFYVLEKLDELGMTQTDLAQRIGRTKKTVSEIVTGKAPVEPETALQFERVLGIPAQFWNNAERQYRDHLVRQAERERLGQQTGKLQSFPVASMRKLGWLPKRSDPVETLSDLLSFFGAASFEALQQVDLSTCSAFRQSAVHRVDSCAILAWLRKGELDARALSCEPFDKERFRAALSEIRQLTTRPHPEGVREAIRLSAAAGVAVVLVPELPGTRTWGATRWLAPGKALIQLSLRGKTDDQLWFTFFHEAGHILLHPKKDIFIELDGTADTREEEANRFAAEILIPPAAWQHLLRIRARSAFEVRQLAAQFRIAPGIVAGRMQREKLIPWTHLNGLKTKLGS